MQKDHHRSRHPHRRTRQDRHPPGRRGQRRRHPVSRHPGARLRKIHRRPPVLRDARRSPRASAASAPSATCWPSAKACDAIMAVRVRRRPPSSCAKPIHCAQFVQSHALSFFHLSAPDLLLGFDSDPARRNVFGLIEANPGAGARRHRAAQIRAGRHRSGWPASACIPSWIVPGGVNAPLTAADRDRILAGLPDARAIAAPHAGPLQEHARPLRRRDRELRLDAHHVRGPGGRGRRARSGTTACSASRIRRATVAAQYRRRAITREFIGEASLRDSYLKAPYFKPTGYPDGVYRVGPLARLNVAERLRHARGRQRTRRVPPALRRDGRTAPSTTTTRA